ncbi:MAG: DUF29 domain-containing protein [Cyanobacteria bacterium P01_A01_bin.17]
MTGTQVSPPSHQQIYETDFVEWIDKAAKLLKQGKFDELDIENLVEEVESLGRSEKNALRSNLRVLLMHLLKWQYQSSKRTGSWKATIREHRKRLQYAFKDSPSLRNYYAAVIEESYKIARELAADETELDVNVFPAECPYTYTSKQILDDGYWPEN